jgi:uncharacterized protein YndB with AHSA1/START domain
VTPLVVEFRVAATPEHAFAMWTARTDLWWPRSHTVTKAKDLDIVFEGRSGGRIYERADDGIEHDWGRVIEWDPPHRLTYSWHLFFDPAEATDVEITFESGANGTDVRIEQRGWERLGAGGEERRTNTNRAWSAIIPQFVEAMSRQ